MGSTTVKAMVVLVETVLKSRLTIAGMMMVQYVYEMEDRFRGVTQMEQDEKVHQGSKK